jgi:pimeloyl-ACP methyl ester carboxylesterase
VGSGRHAVPAVHLASARGGGGPRGAGGGLSEGAAESFASEGFAALALAYFGLDRLPRELVEIPLEYFGGALSWLRSQPWFDAGWLAVVGNSKGGELALLLAAVYPEDIRAVVGYAPSPIVWQGMPLDREFYHGGPLGPSKEKPCRSSRWPGRVPPRWSG